jgi:hypothetical protein
VPGAFIIDKRGKSPCAAACPAGVSTQGYVALIGEGKFKEEIVPIEIKQKKGDPIIFDKEIQQL